MNAIMDSFLMATEAVLPLPNPDYDPAWEAGGK